MELKESKRLYNYRDNYAYSHEASKGDFAFICPHCGHMNLVNINSNIAISTQTHAKIAVHFKFDCLECRKEIKTFDKGIDPNMVDAVSRLIRAGYKVRHCCEGYINNYKINNDIYSDDAYICFSDASIIKKGCPEDWSYDEDYEDGIRLNAKDITSESDKEIIIENLYKWLDRFC